ncbi:response regulator receiver domain protein [Catonella morbi ATCC 51271]|uniref:Stage 0 sporulation protein A homolog n=1 Tax=Catonella morbi ATCC 51271 TaxID=592026 RepID=V2Y1N0_9FIRM|nr:response regulator transcription factor [Catonella morbi]ESL01576.1 response regulator receiver domain protein [Catonella morbi ATCC 51271]
MGKIRILIADDFVYLREDLTELINSQDDMEVVGEAESGSEIIELAEKSDYDIILMDIEMEQTNAGILAAEKIRDKNPDAGIIFLTAHETKEMIVTAMGAGAVDYVVKGVGDEVLLMHIRNAYEGNPVMQSRVRDTVMQEYARLQRSERSLLFFINCISNLTGAERELVKLLLQGSKVSEIADIRKVENSTVKTQIKSLLRKFGCSRSKEVVSLIEELKIGHLF